MKSGHINEILNRTEFKRISDADLRLIVEHTENCSSCRAAFQTARIAAILLENGSSTAIPVPSAFFQAKVMNAVRERVKQPKPFQVFRQWWRSSAALALLMLFIVFGLGVFTLIVSNSNRTVRASLPEPDFYSTETVILNQPTSQNMTDEQIFEMLYSKKSIASDNE